MSGENIKPTSLDYTNAITNAHNERDKATNVVSVNSLVPTRYGRVEVDYYTTGPSAGNIREARYYSDGLYQESKILFTADKIGSAHKTTINFINRTPEQLAGRAFVIFDDNGAVKVWFNVDFSNTEPNVANTYRSIQVNLLSSHTSEVIANRVALALDLDAEFIAVASMQYVIISSNTRGIKPDSYDFNTSLYLKNTAGTDSVSLNNKYFFINSALNANEYYVWYNVDGTGINPAIPGKTGIMVAILSGSSAEVVAQNTKNALDSVNKFVTNINKDSLIIVNKLIGESTKTVDVNTGFVVLTLLLGEGRELLVTLQMTYNTQGNILSVERL